MSVPIEEVSFGKVSGAPLEPCSSTAINGIPVSKVSGASFNLASIVPAERILLGRVSREAEGLLS
jgi:hypothetical protein